MKVDIVTAPELRQITPTIIATFELVGDKVVADIKSESIQREVESGVRNFMDTPQRLLHLSDGQLFLDNLFRVFRGSIMWAQYRESEKGDAQ